MNKKTIFMIGILCFFALLVLFMISSISSGKTEKGVEYLIGMSQANLVEPWRIVLNEEIEAQSKTYDNVKFIYTNATQDTNKQIEDVKLLMDYGVDLLIISPNDDKELRDILDLVYQEIPIIVLDRDIGIEYSLYIGPNNRAIGEMAGHFIIDLLGDEGGTVLELKGLEGSAPSIERSEGFYSVIDRYPKIILKDSLVCDWLKDKAEDQMKYYFVIDSDIDIIFAHNDAMAYGAYIAADELRIDKDIMYIGVNGLGDKGGGLELVDKGILKATFQYPTGGDYAVDYAMKILSGQKNVPNSLELDSKIYVQHAK